MKIVRIIFNLILVLSVLSACDSKRVRTAADPQPEVAVQAKDGVLFIAALNDGTELEVTIYDDYLKAILNDQADIEDKDPLISEDDNYGSRFDLALFGVEYDGEIIDTIKCNEDSRKKLYFRNINDVAVLINQTEIPVDIDLTLNCAGSDGDSYYINIFKSNGWAQKSFALYFDFLQLTVRGRINVKRVGDSTATALFFD